METQNREIRNMQLCELFDRVCDRHGNLTPLRSSDIDDMVYRITNTVEYTAYLVGQLSQLREEEEK